MEPPSTLPGKRVRKRSKRLSETESVGGEIEPARKRAKRGSESSGKNVQGADGEPGRRRRTSRDKGSSAKSKNGRELVISVDLLQHDLRVGGASALPMTSSPLEASPKSGSGSSRRSHSRTPVNGNGTNGDSFSRRTLATNFKNPNFTISYLSANKKKPWKNLKQVIAAEKALGWSPDDPIYSSIDAPPSLKPPKKYADMSGLTAKYTDPMTGIYFNTSEEFQLVRTLPTDIVQGYLALRGKLAIT